MASGQTGSALPHIQRLFAEGSLTGLSDGQLLERYRARGDELAFAALVERHAALVLAVCRRSLENPADIDDAFQATFLVLVRRCRAVRRREVLGSWLFGVSRRVCLMANRTAARRRKHERRAAEQRGSRDGAVVAHDEPGDSVYEEIERLPSAYRLPLVLCLMEGRTKEEAAAELHWTEGMVRGRLARAKALLQSRLIRRGVAPATALEALTREGRAGGAVPRGLIEGATRAATSATTAAVAWTERVIKIMLLKKLTLVSAVLFGVILVTWAATAAMVPGENDDPPAGKPLPIAAAQAAPGPRLPARNRAAR